MCNCSFFIIQILTKQNITDNYLQDIEDKAQMCMSLFNNQGKSMITKLYNDEGASFSSH
jgi:hypothetical protein